MRLHSSGKYTIAELMEVISVGRATVYGVLHRAKQKTAQAHLAGRALRHHDAACGRPGPGQTGNVTPVSSSRLHRRRWMAVSWDCPLDSASLGCG